MVAPDGGGLVLVRRSGQEVEARPARAALTQILSDLLPPRIVGGMTNDLVLLLDGIRRQMAEDAGATPAVKIQPKDTKPDRAPERKIHLPDEEPDENDCKRVGQSLRSVFGRKMCIDPKMTAVTGVPAVRRKAASVGTRSDRPAVARREHLDALTAELRALW